MSHEQILSRSRFTTFCMTKYGEKRALIVFDKHPVKEQLSYCLVEIDFHLGDGGFVDIDLDFQPEASFDNGDFFEYDLTM